MIQRIQSIFLFLSGISFFSLFGLPFAQSTQSIPHIFTDMVYNIYDSPVLLALVVLGGLISVGAIFLYNNRALQIKMSYLTVVLSILLMVVAVLLVFNERTSGAGAETITKSAGVAMPVVSLIMSILAARNIKKDENTVRSMDRLR
jgi:glucan phosphoethanolaminetransferase (alkaline phosphatase superfamily)